MDWAWFGRSLAIVVTALSVSACQTSGSIKPDGNVLGPSTGSSLGTIPASTPMPTGAEHGPIPPGFISFCMRFSSQCQAPENQPEIISLTAQSWGLLSQVNERTNASIWPEDDERHYGRGEFWTIPTDGYGDCEDYALTKRKQLIGVGFPEPALRIAIVITPREARHAVLTVATDKGDYVLDNLNNDVVAWNATGYTWIERQDARRPLAWVSLQSPTIVAANDDQTVASVTSPAQPASSTSIK